MTDKAGKLLEICTKLIETAAVLEITDLELDTVKNSARVGHPSEGYAFTGYGEVRLKVMFAPKTIVTMPPPPQWVKDIDDRIMGVIEGKKADETKRIEAANTIKGQDTEA